MSLLNRLKKLESKMSLEQMRNDEELANRIQELLNQGGSKAARVATILAQAARRGGFTSKAEELETYASKQELNNELTN